jgi:hypothetical protein
LSKNHLKEFIGFGIAGNFAKHLEQANEASDFVDVVVDDENAPKGIFPFYLPNSSTFLGTYPLSSSAIIHPRGSEVVQLEPELAIICELVYDGDMVVDIVPNYFTAYNDCSIRKEGAKKISHKKNWGEDTKGISSTILPIDKFSNGGVLDNYNIASFVKRDGVVYEYGKDSSVITYNYFYDKLKEWIINKLNTQKDFGPLEDLHSYILESNRPKGAIISVGATSYTPFGESNFLEIGDEVFVYIYDRREHSFDDIVAIVNSDNPNSVKNSSLLHQKIL